MKIFDDEQRDQRRPNLRIDGVGAGAQKRLNFEILFYCLKKQFNLPAVFVDRRDRRGPERLVIGQENDRFLFIVIPDLHSAEEVLVLRLGQTREEDHFIAKHVAVLWNSPLFDHFINRLVLEARDKKHALTAQS